MALKRYKTLDECLEKNSFNKKDVCIAGTHIVAKRTVSEYIRQTKIGEKEVTYICHITFKNEAWCIDECKVYEKHEAIKLMTKFAIEEAGETR